jgi:hypothetical protein
MSVALKSLLIDIVGGIAAMIVAAWAFTRLLEARVPHRPSNTGDVGGVGDMSGGQAPHLFDSSDAGATGSSGGDAAGGDGSH